MIKRYDEYITEKMTIREVIKSLDTRKNDGRELSIKLSINDFNVTLSGKQGDVKDFLSEILTNSDRLSNSITIDV